MFTTPYHFLQKPKPQTINVTVYGQEVSLRYWADFDEYSGNRYDKEHDRWFVLYKWDDHYHVQENLPDENIADVGDYPDFISALSALASAGLQGQTYPVEDMHNYAAA